MKRLTAIGISKSSAGKLEDGGGLRLVKRTNNQGKWVFRYSFLGKRREMGLGPFPEISLAEARKLRDQWANILAHGQDPIVVRLEDTQKQKEELHKNDPTFAELAELVFEGRKAQLRGGGDRGRWFSPIKLYMIPAIGKKRGSEITQHDIYDALRPIWRTKHPTATKVVERTRIILRSSQRMGFPVSQDIVDAAKEMLGTVNHKIEHMAALDWQDIPGLYHSLRESTSALCIKWAILTVVRSDGVRGARVDEIDFDNAIWTVPKTRIKGTVKSANDFRVPLTQPLMDMATSAREFGMTCLFPGKVNPNKPITDVGVSKTLKDLAPNTTLHGLRTSFRTWVQDTQSCSFEVAETILGHSVGNKVERSYARSDLLDLRRDALEKWAKFVQNHPD